MVCFRRSLTTFIPMHRQRLGAVSPSRNLDTPIIPHTNDLPPLQAAHNGQIPHNITTPLIQAVDLDACAGAPIQRAQDQLARRRRGYYARAVPCPGYAGEDVGVAG